MPSNQSGITEQAKFTYSRLGKAFKKKKKKKQLKNKEKKQVQALEVLKPNTQKLTVKDAIPENTLTGKAKNEPNKIKGIEKMVDKENFFYRTN